MPIGIWFAEQRHDFQENAARSMSLGTVLEYIASPGEDDDSLVQLHRALRANPWVSVVATRSEADTLEGMLFDPSRLLIRQAEKDSTAVSAEALARAERPELEQFLGYLALRLSRSQTGLVRQLFHRWAKTPLMTRRMKRAGLPAPVLWYDLWLLLYAQGAVPATDWSVRELAAIRRVTGVEVRAMARDLFGLSLKESATLPWRARVETFLRQKRIRLHSVVEEQP